MGPNLFPILANLCFGHFLPGTSSAIPTIWTIQSVNPDTTFIPTSDISKKVLKYVSVHVCAAHCQAADRCLFFAVWMEDRACHLFHSYRPELVINHQVTETYIRVSSIVTKGKKMLLLRHDLTQTNTFFERSQLSVNALNDTAPIFACLDRLEDVWNSNKTFHFEMCYPELNNTDCIEWTQTSSPLKEGQVEGFSPIKDPFPTNDVNNTFKGLGKGGSSSLMDGQPMRSNFWWAVGIHGQYQNESQIPGPIGQLVRIIHLSAWLHL